MPFALIIVGLVLLVAAIRGTTSGPDGLFELVKGDFQGEGNFVYWVVSILIIGSIGYIPRLRPLSVAFLTLVIVVLFLTRGDPNKASGGFFEKFTGALGLTTATRTGSTTN